MLQEFYYRSALLPPFSDFSRADKGSANSVRPLRLFQLLELEPQRRQWLVDDLKQFLQKVLSKEMVTTALVHELMLQFLEVASPDVQSEFIEQIAPLSTQFMQSKSGCAVVIHCISYATPKFRKQFLKSFKGHVAEMSQDGFAWRVISRALSVVDDTVLLRKTVGAELSQALRRDPSAEKTVEELRKPKDVSDSPFVLHENVIRLLLFLLNPSSARYFTEETRLLLSPPVTPSNDPANPPKSRVTNKKKPEVLRSEVLKFLFPDVLSSCVDDMAKLFHSKLGADLLIEVFLECARQCSSSLSDQSIQFSNSLLSEIVSDPRMLDGPEHRTVKRLISELSSLCGSSSDSNEFGVRFIRQLVDFLCSSSDPDAMTDDAESPLADIKRKPLSQWAQTRATFVFCELLRQTVDPSSGKSLRAQLRPLKKTLRRDTHAGARHLLDALKLSS